MRKQLSIRPCAKWLLAPRIAAAAVIALGLTAGAHVAMAQLSGDEFVNTNREGVRATRQIPSAAANHITTASGADSGSIGYASGGDGTAVGAGREASGTGSAAIRVLGTASGSESTAVAPSAVLKLSSDDNGSALDQDCTSTGKAGTASGENEPASGLERTTVGQQRSFRKLPASNPCRAQPSQREANYNIELMLVRSVITAVNHANITGNYTVLRDLGCPAFRERNSAAQLAAIFQQLRDQQTDLSPTLTLDPQFSEQPGIDGAGELRVVGYFPTQPLQVQFRLLFQKVGNGWGIDTVSIGTSRAQQQVRQLPPPMQQPNYDPPEQASGTAIASRPQDDYDYERQ